MCLNTELVFVITKLLKIKVLFFSKVKLQYIEKIKRNKIDTLALVANCSNTLFETNFQVDLIVGVHIFHSFLRHLHGSVRHIQEFERISQQPRSVFMKILTTKSTKHLLISLKYILFFA